MLDYQGRLKAFKKHKHQSKKAPKVSNFIEIHIMNLKTVKILAWAGTADYHVKISLKSIHHTLHNTSSSRQPKLLNPTINPYLT
jgi:hypothetical protein